MKIESSIRLLLGLTMAFMPRGVFAQETTSPDSDTMHFSETVDDPIGETFIMVCNSSLVRDLDVWPPELLIIPVDFNSDGLNDVLISANYFTNGQSGEMWNVYKKNPDGHWESGVVVCFNHDSAVMIQSPARESISIFDLRSAGSKTGSLVEIKLSDSGSKEDAVRSYNWDRQEDIAYWDSIRDSSGSIGNLVKRMNFGPLQQLYAGRVYQDISPVAISGKNSPPKVPLDYRNPEYADEFVDSIEEMYVLLEVPLPKVSSRSAQVPKEESEVEANSGNQNTRIMPPTNPHAESEVLPLTPPESVRKLTKSAEEPTKVKTNGALIFGAIVLLIAVVAITRFRRV